MQPNRTTLIFTTAAVALPSTLAIPAAAIASAAGPAASAAASKTVSGPVVSMRWGPVQARVTVRRHRLLAVGISAPTEKPRSARINGRAVPLLRSEALRAQSSRISTVSGATLTSRAFISSLGTALRKAGV